MIISTGMATVAELDETVRAARESGCRELVLLKCTSSYPSTPHDTNIATIPHMRELFGCQVGLSDHTMGIGVAVASIALGATVVEKHFTLRRADGGVDSAFSLEPEEMRMLVLETERAWQSLGNVSYGPSGDEAQITQVPPLVVCCSGHRAEGTTDARQSARYPSGIRPLTEVSRNRARQDCCSRGQAWHSAYVGLVGMNF